MFESVITARELTYSPGSRPILEAINLEIRRGSFTVVVGENGAGKTTLLKLLMGLATPTSGTVSVAGKTPHADPFHDRQRIAYINERMTPPNDWSIADYLEFNRRFYARYSRDLEKTLLREFRLDPLARVGNLSAGEIRRIQVVAALAISPEILLIDEITAVLDIVGRSKFMTALRRLQSTEHATILMATNIIDDVDSYATDVILLHQGKLRLQSTKDDLLHARKGATLTDLLASLIEDTDKRRPEALA